MDPINEAYKKTISSQPEFKPTAAYKKYRKYLEALCKKHKIKFTSSNDNYDLMLKLEDAGVEVE